jgi:hypothetical protein
MKYLTDFGETVFTVIVFAFVIGVIAVAFAGFLS